MTTVADILHFMETIAPPYMKMDWDNAGLLCGSKSAPVTKILVALDPFEGVCREAVDCGAELIVTHHPLIFTPLKSVTDETSIGRSIIELCRHGISAINAHTNLDCASGGVNDVLADVLGLRNTEVIRPFFRDSHDRQWGLLRRGIVEEQPLSDFLTTVKHNLKAEGLRYVDGGRPVRVVAVGGGHCADELLDAFEEGCDTFVTADIKYNQFWDAKDLGMNLIDAGHFHTENPAMLVLAQKLQAAFPETEVIFSRRHSDPMAFF